MQSLSQRQRLLQKLSPQQIQLMKLMEVPTLYLEERIQEELNENPALEMADTGEDDWTDTDSLPESNTDDTNDASNESDTDTDAEPNELNDDFDINDLLPGDDDAPAYATKADYNPDDEEAPAYQPSFHVSFYEHLMDQVNVLNLSDIDHALAEFIIGSIDDNGYLTRDVQAITDDVQIRGNLPVNENDVRRVLEQVKQFEPAGVAAIDLRECLLLQLQRKPLDDTNRHAQTMLRQYFDEFSRKQYDKLQRSLGINETELREAIKLITHLNPKPGAVFADGPSSGAQTVMADFTVVQEGGQLDLQIHGRNAPELRVSTAYREMLETYAQGAQQSRSQREALQFVKQKIESAKWFIDAIEQRRNTLLQTMSQILRLQEAFFLSGDEAKLKPMILKDVADATGLDISTISRVVNSKYVQTEYGLFKLKFFFSEGMANKEGEEVSTREVKSLLAELIQAEDKHQPLTDDQLTERLAEKGYPIARRTVAKYREQLGILKAGLRKAL
ncbi:MAG: RNA polymerase factor sigma-54 [Chitinophagaceae bacterium]